MSLYVVDLPAAYRDGHNSWDVLDSVDSGLAHFCSVVSLRTLRFKPTLARLAHAEIGLLLVLSHLWIGPQHRGRGLGLSAIQVACARVGAGCSLAVLKAFPTQWEGRVAEGPEDFRKDQAKLVAYYRQVGFVPVLGGGLMARCPADEL